MVRCPSHFFLDAYVLWKINPIHPFINGNGRTARVTCYFILCAREGQWIAVDPILPELLREEPHRSRYIDALKYADQSNELQPLISVITEALIIQLSGSEG